MFYGCANTPAATVTSALSLAVSSSHVMLVDSISLTIVELNFVIHRHPSHY